MEHLSLKNPSINQSVFWIIKLWSSNSIKDMSFLSRPKCNSSLNNLSINHSVFWIVKLLSINSIKDMTFLTRSKCNISLKNPSIEQSVFWRVKLWILNQWYIKRILLLIDVGTKYFHWIFIKTNKEIYKQVKSWSSNSIKDMNFLTRSKWKISLSTVH